MTYSLADIKGNNIIRENLLSAVNDGRCSHAYIFCGPKGIGKSTLAFAFARSLVCKNPKLGSPCENCNDCIKSNINSHPDIIKIEGEGKSGAIKVESIRHLKADVYIRPNDSERKIYIIEDAETMGAPSQNALLKIFEEPPSYAVIILLADSLDAILPTLRSRAVICSVKPLNVNELRGFLKEKFPTVDNDSITAALLISDGNPGKAIEVITDESIAQNMLLAEEIAVLCSKNSFYDLIMLAPKLSHDKDRIAEIAEMLAMLLRDTMVLRENCSVQTLSGDAAKRLLINAPGLTNSAAIAIIKTLCELKRAIDANVSTNLALNFLINCWEAAH